MVKKKKLKDEFSEFRNTDKSAYKTFKIPLKSILQNRSLVQPVINNLVFEMNDLVIHAYQFIRFYVITCYSNKTDLPVIDDTFILYCLKVLGTRDNRGRQMANVGLLESLETFYIDEYQPLLNHEKTNLKNKTFLLPYLATQINTSLSTFSFNDGGMVYCDKPSVEVHNSQVLLLLSCNVCNTVDSCCVLSAKNTSN